MQLQWLQNEVEAHCPVCGDEGRKAAVLTTDHLLEGYEPVTFLRCACGAVFVRDLAVPDYEHEMTELLDYYVEQGAGVDLIVAPLLRIPSPSVRRCLEIGCSYGFALDFSRYAFGWDVVGVDPSPLAKAGAAALGLPILPTYFDAELDLGSEGFDVVLCSEILEHLAEPRALLMAMRERLSEEGMLVLSTPNAAIVRRGTSEGPLGRALSPGLHLILYDRGALLRLLAEAGFSNVVLEESSETLRAFAACSPAPIERLRPVDADVGSALLRAYFDDRASRADPRSTEACGFAYRHFKECVNRGLYDEAIASRDRLFGIYRARFALDLEQPQTIGSSFASPFPFNLVGSLFFSGILELNALGRPDRAGQSFAAAVAIGATMLAEHGPYGLYDGETEALIRESRRHLPMALAATDPDRAVDEVEALESADVAGDLVADTRAQTFVRLVNAGASEAAARLARDVANDLDLASLEERGEERAGALDPLFCLGILALQQSRFHEASEDFARVYRAALRRVRPERAELLWSARYHEALSLRLGGSEAQARAALTELIGEGTGDLPPVPPALAEAASVLLAAGES